MNAVDTGQPDAALHLKYFQYYPNAGDQFGRVLAQHYFSANIIPCDERPLALPNLLLLGSILQWADSMSYVCGAGLIASDVQLPNPPKRINCVRGPLTAYCLDRQGIRCAGPFGDPGLLAQRLFPQNPATRFKVGVIPHYIDAASPWLAACHQKGVPVIDALSPLSQYFERLQQCEVILSSSLHGIIFAHAYGKPALWIEITNGVVGGGFKFYDYYLSIGVPCSRVVRMRIADNSEPYELAKLATIGDHSRLLPSLELAIQQTKRDLQLLG